MNVIGPALVAVAAITVAQPAGLPGAGGPQIEVVGTLPDKHELVEAFVYATPDQAAHGVVRPRRFPAGTARLKLDVRLKRLPRAGMRLRYDLVTTTGPVALDDGFVSFVQLTTIEAASLDFELIPKNPPFPPGPYRLTFWMEDNPVLALNFSVGE
jgi:hypothetical protein